VNNYTAQLTYSPADALSSIKGRFALQKYLNFCIYCSRDHTATYLKEAAYIFPHPTCLSCCRADFVVSSPVQGALYYCGPSVC